jgi:hypothetical protein
MPEEFIVKAQIPLYSSDGSSHVLVYNEDRSIMHEIPIISLNELIELKKDMDAFGKGFFWAYRDGEKVVLRRPAPWQQW